MSRIAFVNGSYVRQSEPAINLEDRGFQFADGVYEVIAVRDGQLVDEDGHFRRLGRSLGELAIGWPCSRAALGLIARQVVRRNFVRHGFLYVQVTRGVAPRNHAFPARTAPSLVVSASHARPPPAAVLDQGVELITLADNRWKRPDIKSISLLPNVLAKQRARESGAHEAWFVDEHGFITEGTSTNAWMVTHAGEVLTRPLGHAILAGITRRVLLEAARGNSITVLERAFTVAEAKGGAEAFLTSTTNFVLPVIAIDGTPIGDGKPGPVTVKLIAHYRNHMDRGQSTGGGRRR
jgi:D-alanine transaminase